MDAVLFLAEPDHLFDPKLWSAVKVSGKNDGASEFTIDADYFAQLVGIQPKQADAKLSFFVDKGDNYTFTLTITISDDDGNCLQTEVHAAANKLDEQNTITAPKLLLTDEQIEQLKDLAEPFIDSIKK